VAAGDQARAGDEGVPRVYGGSRIMTAFKTVPPVLLYLVTFFIFGLGFITYMAVITF
jgi:hypothetical protein